MRPILSNRWAVYASSILLAVVMLAIWQLLAAYEVISSLFFPPPSRTLAKLWLLMTQGDIWPPTWATIVRMIYGWAAASVAGVILGALITRSKIIHELIGPTLEFMRPMPASAFIPLAILAFGLTNQMSTAIIAFGSLWPVLLAAIQGFSTVHPRLYEVADALGMSQWQRFIKVSLPSALTDIVAGARVGLAIALILAVVTEMQASLPGLGQSILMAQRSFQTPELYASVIMLGCVGFLASTLLQWCERLVIPWRATS